MDHNFPRSRHSPTPGADETQTRRQTSPPAPTPAHTFVSSSETRAAAAPTLAPMANPTETPASAAFGASLHNRTPSPTQPPTPSPTQPQSSTPPLAYLQEQTQTQTQQHSALALENSQVRTDATDHTTNNKYTLTNQVPEPLVSKSAAAILSPAAPAAPATTPLQPQAQQQPRSRQKQQHQSTPIPLLASSTTGIARPNTIAVIPPPLPPTRTGSTTTPTTIPPAPANFAYTSPSAPISAFYQYTSQDAANLSNAAHGRPEQTEQAQAEILPPRPDQASSSMSYPTSPTRNSARRNPVIREREQFLIFIKILFKLLDQTQQAERRMRAQTIVMTCRRKNQQGDPDFMPLIDAIVPRLKTLVGDAEWRKAHIYLRHYVSKRGRSTKREMNATPPGSTGTTSMTTSTTPTANEMQPTHLNATQAYAV